MPLSVPTNRTTITGTSRSQPRWCPEDVLELSLDGCCVGYAPSKRRECHNRIRYHDVHSLVIAMAEKQPDPERLRPDLVSLARHGLCYLHRNTQCEGVVNKWTSRMEAAFPVEVGRTRELGPAMQGRPATAAFTSVQLDSLRSRVAQQVVQQLEPLDSTTSPRYGAAHSAAAESVVVPERARSMNRPIIAAAPVGPAEPISGTTPLSSATSLPNVSQVEPRPTPQRCTRPHARRLPLDEECPICYEGGPLSECDASEVVWCRSNCGRSVHKTCFQDWRAQCGTDRNRLTCAVCRSDWHEHSGCNLCDAVHARRRPIEGDCAICRDVLVEDRSTAASKEDLVWCKSSCGQSVHRQCFNSWMRQCVANGRVATCVSCRASWSEECEC